MNGCERCATPSRSPSPVADPAFRGRQAGDCQLRRLLAGHTSRTVGSDRGRFDHNGVMPHPGLDRATEDLEAGRLWKARDRASGLFGARPTDQDVLGLTGEIYYRMGDLPRAAAFWYLTDRSGPEVVEALEAMHERYPRAEDVVAVLPIRARIDAFPHPVQLRLRELQDALAVETGRTWEPGPRPLRRAGARSSRALRLRRPGFDLVVGLCLAAWGVGVITIVRWIAGAI